MRAKTTAAVLAAAVLAATATTGAASAAWPARSCRPAWALVATPPVPGSQEGQDATSGVSAAVDSVSPVSVRNIWFSAEADSPSLQPWVMRWGGKAVRPAAQMPPLPLDGQYGGVGSFDSAADGWVLTTNAYATPPGMGGQDDPLASPYAERWHHGRWTMTPLPTSPDPTTKGTELQDVSSLSAANAWAVGMVFAARPGVIAGAVPVGALIEHWGGNSWRIVPNPAAARRGAQLTALTVISPGNIWAVGRQHNPSGTIVPLAEHWDGESWRTLPAPAGAPPSALDAVSATSSGNVWAVGDQTKPGTSDVAIPLAEHWDGKSWTVASLPDVGNALLTGVYTASPADTWATVQTPPGKAATFLHLTGHSWAAVPAPGPQEYGVLYLYAAISGTGPRDIWAVGTASNPTSDNPVIAHLGCR